MKPMRMWVLLAVFWAAGSLLLAAESRAPAPRAAASEGDSKPADESAPAQTASSESEGAPTSDRADSQPAQAGAKPGAQAESPTAEQADGADTDATAPKAASTGPGATAADRGPSPQRFVPSEQVRADFDVSFPIDI